MDEHEAVSRLADTLLPGDCGFPSASATGMMAILVTRLRETEATLPGRLVAAVTAQGNWPGDTAAWQETARRLEAVEPKLFDEIRKYSYLTYYEQPAVIAAIRALGFRYNDSPLPDGYPAEPFDMEHDGPRHQRGRWLATDQVRRVDLSTLGLEQSP